MNPKPLILIVDDESANLRLLQMALEPKGYEVISARDGREALEKVHEKKIDVIILDVMMPGLTGIEVKKKLNENPSTADIPVIFLTGRSELGDKVEGLNLNADDYMTKPYEIVELLARVKTVLNRKTHYETISMTDGLTGLPNIHVYERQLSHLFQIAKRYKRAFSLAIIDIDNFKAINDTYGHLAGDFAIKSLAETIVRTFRKPDITIRYGGDEFVVLFPESKEEQAEVAIQRLKNQINGKEFVMMDGKRILVSISVGLAGYREEYQNESEIFQIADKNMYKEKLAKKQQASS